MVISHGTRVVRGREVPSPNSRMSKQQNSLTLFFLSYCIINKYVGGVESKFDSPQPPYFLVLVVEHLKSFSAPILDTLDWTVSAGWGVMKAFSQERPVGKHTAGPEWEVYFAWCMHICGMWGSLHRGLQEHSGFCTEEFIAAAPLPPPPPPLFHCLCILITPNSSLMLILFLFSTLPVLPIICRLK